MKTSTIIGTALLVAPASLQGVPASGALTDADILNFALILEHLEATFYSEGLAKYDAEAFKKAGFSNDIRDKIQAISDDETSHVNFLTTALQAAGATPVQACNYTFPYSDPKSFLAVSQILEGVGVSAYLGAAGSIQNANYLTAAGSILTVEARHNAYIRLVNGESPFPTAFDTPVDPRSIVTLATPFFSACPNGSAPAFKGFPALNVTGKLVAGSSLNVAATNVTGATTCAFLSGLNTTFSPFADGKCQVPNDGKVGGGQVYVLLTSSQNVSDSSTVAGPAIVESEVPGNVTTRNLATASSNAGSKDSAASSVMAGGYAFMLTAIAGVLSCLV